MKWSCKLCGYIHEGDIPPESCPICTVAAAEFEKVEDQKTDGLEEKDSISWRCLVCDYVHKGQYPPDICPVCGVDSTNFEKVGTESKPEVKNNSHQPINKNQPVNKVDAIKIAIRSISYGLFIITSSYEGKDNGQTANTCFQITSDPVQIAIGINKNNYTHELISQSQKFGVSILDQNGHELARKFGYRSGRDFDKFEGVNAHRGSSGVMLLDEVLAVLEAEVVNKIDAGTHTLFLGKVIGAEVLSSGEPMTYAYFRSKK